MDLLVPCIFAMEWGGMDGGESRTVVRRWQWDQFGVVVWRHYGTLCGVERYVNFCWPLDGRNVVDETAFQFKCEDPNDAIHIIIIHICTHIVYSIFFFSFFGLLILSFYAFTELIAFHTPQSSSDNDLNANSRIEAHTTKRKKKQQQTIILILLLPIPVPSLEHAFFIGPNMFLTQTAQWVVGISLSISNR